MHVSIDPEADILYTKLRPGPVEESEAVEPGLLVDYAEDGSIVALEVWRISQRVAQAAAAS